MAILKTITTVSPIVDADGVNAFGWLRVRPNAPFEYNDGSNNISVTDAIIECQLVDGAIYAVGGVVAADLSLAPNTGASNTPETYYIVDLELNGTTDRQYWRIASSSGGAGSVDLEYVNVPRVPGPDNGSSDTLAAHLAATNPHTQYVLRADTVAAGGTTTGAASDGLGKIPRCNTTTGDLDASVLPVSDLISQVITNGVTTKAPSEDAVFDALALKQPLDTELTQIAAISPAADAVIQYKSSNWTGRTMAQLGADLASTLVKQTITNSVTDSAPSQDAVYDALALKMGALSYEDSDIIHAGTDWQSVGFTDDDVRRYLFATILSVSAGATTDYTVCRLAGDYGSPTRSATVIQTYKSNAGASTVTVRAWYTTVY